VASAEITPRSEETAVTPREGRSLLKLIRAAADAAAAVIRTSESKRGQLDWREKGHSDFVTDVDIAAQAAAIEVLRAGEPEAGFLAEESGQGAGPPSVQGTVHDLRFIIDPLDGTTNFIHGFPDYAVSIGAESGGMLVAGVVFNVARGECFEAARGGGAWLGDARLRVSSVDVPKRALIGTGFPFRDSAAIPAYLQQFARVMTGSSGVRRAGAAAVDLAHIAAGKLDGFWENTLSPWDVAAGILLVREAGGVCTDLSGVDSVPEFTSYCAGNPAIHKWLLSQVSAPHART
jgi:myo-inositol-1(or 4)-monophosphatase